MRGVGEDLQDQLDLVTNWRSQGLVTACQVTRGLRVRRLQGLRVVDASAMPALGSANLTRRRS